MAGDHRNKSEHRLIWIGKFQETIHKTKQKFHSLPADDEANKSN
jgi:hypothetical protein